jgi:hypothetical protein
MSKPDFNKTIALVRAEAHDRREGAAWNGAMDDGGSGRLLRDIEYFEYGLQGKLPPNWSKYYESAQAKADPEWETYCRLKDKFKGK